MDEVGLSNVRGDVACTAEIFMGSGKSHYFVPLYYLYL